MNSFSTYVVWFSLLSAMVMVSFQNCAGSQFLSEDGASDDRSRLQNCSDPNCQSILNGAGSCQFNGQSIPHGSQVNAFQSSSVAQGSRCQSETRTCLNGVLSGTYTFSACQVGTSSACLFNGVQIESGQSVIAYQASSVSTGQSCQQETRTCQNGVLSGQFVHASCVVGGFASCQFDGKTILHGSGVFAYLASSVPAGQSCTSQFRLCQNGSLTGSYVYPSCSSQAPASCQFNGQAISSGTSVIAFQNSSVPFGQACISESRQCSNGVLGGSYTSPSCRVAQPASCQFDGLAIAHGSTVLAYQNSAVAFGQTCVLETRRCENGLLSGSYNYSNCAVAQPSGCQFNGLTIAHGAKVSAFLNSSVAFGQSCQSEERTCTNGMLSGSFNFAGCEVATPASCQFNGRSVAHGERVDAYLTSSAPFGRLCTLESRLCTNGSLSGSYNFASCATEQPASCLFDGKTIAHGERVAAYKTSSVPNSAVCESEMRECSNGQLSGTFTFGSCQINQPRSCLFDGRTISHGERVVGFKTSSVPFGQTCQSESRVCQDGTLTGNFAYGSCQVAGPVACLFDDKTIPHGSSIIAYQSQTVPFNQNCQGVRRYCVNGTLSGSGNFSTCRTQPGKTCLFNRQTIGHGSNIIAFDVYNPKLKTCAREVRSCYDGVLSGRYLNTQCSKPIAKKDCALAGKRIPHGQTITAYKSQVGILGQNQRPIIVTTSGGSKGVTCGGQCQSEKRTCNDGVLSGTFRYLNCRPGTPCWGQPITCLGRGVSANHPLCGVLSDQNYQPDDTAQPSYDNNPK